MCWGWWWTAVLKPLVSMWFCRYRHSKKIEQSYSRIYTVTQCFPQSFSCVQLVLLYGWVQETTEIRRSTTGALWRRSRHQGCRPTHTLASGMMSGTESGTWIPWKPITGWWWPEHEFYFPYYILLYFEYVLSNNPNWAIFLRGGQTTSQTRSRWKIHGEWIPPYKNGHVLC